MSASPTTANNNNEPIGSIVPPGTKYKPRQQVKYQDRVIYEWEQDLEEVNIYIVPPPGITAKQLDIVITESHLKVAIKGSTPYLDEDLGGIIVIDSSYWTLLDGILQFQLQKALIGTTWDYCTDSKNNNTVNSKLDPIAQKQVKQQILLERFNREHPGFDFSQAQFNGLAPDARQFMGGLDNNKIKR